MAIITLVEHSTNSPPQKTSDPPLGAFHHEINWLLVEGTNGLRATGGTPTQLAGRELFEAALTTQWATTYRAPGINTNTN